MVKGISKQVIVVNAPEPELFEQAIFILNERAVSREGITEELLLKEAKSLIGMQRRKRGSVGINASLWCAAGAFATGLIWLLTSVF